MDTIFLSEEVNRIHFWDFGIITKSMVREYLCGLMEENIMDNT